MSNWINWRIALIRHPDLSSGAKGMGLYLNTFMNDRHDFAYPSIATIAGEMNMSQTTALKYLSELDEKGFLVREKRFGKTVIYHATVPSIVTSTVLQELECSIPESGVTVFQDLECNKQENKQDNNTPSNEGESPAKAGRRSDCPHERILDLYHETLPMLPGIRVWDETDRRAMRTFWNKNPDLEWIRGYFQHVAGSPFLRGENQRNWRADLRWLIKPANFKKVYEGKFNG